MSDLALLKALPEAVRGMLEALVGCVAGAVLVAEYRAMIEAVGISHIDLKLKPEYVEALSLFEDPLYRRIAEALPKGSRAADYITSVDVTARKRQ